MPDITFHDDPDARRFELHVDGELASLITYGLDDGVLSLRHAETASDFGGQGYATRLTDWVLDRAAAEGQSVLPFCPFTADHIAKHPERIPLVPEDRRAAFGLAG